MWGASPFSIHSAIHMAVILFGFLIMAGGFWRWEEDHTCCVVKELLGLHAGGTWLFPGVRCRMDVLGR